MVWPVSGAFINIWRRTSLQNGKNCMFARPISWASINGVDLETFVKVNVSRQLQGDFKWRLLQRGVFWKEIGCCWKIVIGRRRSEEAKQAHYGSLRALLTLPLPGGSAISNYLGSPEKLEKVKCAICNGYFSKKTTQQVCFFFYFKKERNQLSRKPNDHGCVSFCKGTKRRWYTPE